VKCAEPCLYRLFKKAFNSATRMPRNKSAWRKLSQRLLGEGWKKFEWELGKINEKGKVLETMLKLVLE